MIQLFSIVFKAVNFDGKSIDSPQLDLDEMLELETLLFRGLFSNDLLDLLVDFILLIDVSLLLVVVFFHDFDVLNTLLVADSLHSLQLFHFLRLLLHCVDH